jgi:hypothetical protein
VRADPDVRAQDIAALGWLADGADAATLLAWQPASCETPKDGTDILRGSNDALLSMRDLGRVAFESPVLLGGAAARSGLSCSSFHVNGRGNPQFFIRGVSGAPGTADVTNSILSKTRGDGLFNPVAIPDIGMRDGTQIRDRRSPAFRDKVHGLIAAEFDGGEPQPRAFAAVMAYLDGLDPAACVNGAVARPSGAADVEAAEMAALAAEGLADLSTEERAFWLRVSRDRLARIHERMAGPELQLARDRLLAMSASLADAAQKARAEQAFAVDQAAWLQLSMTVREAQPKSLYNPEVLRAALAGRGP